MLISSKKYRIEEIDKEGKLYSNVSRAKLVSEDSSVLLDYHSILLRLSVDDIINIQMYNTLEEDLKCDYSMNGKVYKIEKASNGCIVVYASFGGLLMIQEIDSSKADGLHERSKISIFITKV